MRGPVKWRTIVLPDESACFASGVVFLDGTTLRKGVASIEMSSNTSSPSAFGPDGLV